MLNNLLERNFSLAATNLYERKEINADFEINKIKSKNN